MLNSKMLRRLAAGAAFAAMAVTGVPAAAQDNPRVAAEIMTIVRSQWAAEISNQSGAQQLVAVADDYTEFNPDYPTLLVGKPMAIAMTAIAPDVKPVFSEMQNPRVQVYGDTAILTYNFAGLTRGADGKVKPTVGKSTRVYARQGGKWMLVHAHFAAVHAGQ
jgi:ketosteroid isomerase-like protein